MLAAQINVDFLVAAAQGAFDCCHGAKVEVTGQDAGSGKKPRSGLRHLGDTRTQKVRVGRDVPIAPRTCNLGFDPARKTGIGDRNSPVPQKPPEGESTPPAKPVLNGQQLRPASPWKQVSSVVRTHFLGP